MKKNSKKSKAKVSKSKKNIPKYLMVLIIVIISIVIGWLLTYIIGNNEYKVTFDSNGGSLVTERIVEKGSVLVRPKDPTKDGYDFVEWQLNGKNYDFSTKVIESINLAAVWEKKKEIVCPLGYNLIDDECIIEE